MPLNWYKIAQVTPPIEAYHVTYLSRLNNIKSRGLLLPKNMPFNWRTTGAASYEDRIYLFANPADVAKVADHISLDDSKDWVLLKVTGLDPNFLTDDGDWGETWQDSMQVYGTFGYMKSIPPGNVMPIKYEIKTPGKRHNAFEE